MPATISNYQPSNARSASNSEASNTRSAETATQEARSASNYLAIVSLETHAVQATVKQVTHEVPEAQRK